jgi:nitric oxide reductase subunit B
MELIPLIVLTLEASRFVGLTRIDDVLGAASSLPHKWTFYFLVSVGVWNFIGAGLFGFLVNLPIVSFYEAGTNLTANHAHGALMGVFGMLGVALTVFALREVSDDAHWLRIRNYIRMSFWGLNIGLAGMVLLNLFPSGVLQLQDVVRNGYWHARSPLFAERPLLQMLEWARMPADIIFITLGVLPLTWATCLTWLRMRSHGNNS